MKKIRYCIDGVNEDFPSLRAAKLHVDLAYTPEERLKELKGTSITGYEYDEPITITPILLDERGNNAFGKTQDLYLLQIGYKSR